MITQEDTKPNMEEKTEEGEDSEEKRKWDIEWDMIHDIEQVDEFDKKLYLEQDTEPDAERDKE